MSWFSVITDFFVGLLRGWYAEYSRDKAHKDLGQAEAKLENEKNALKKIKDADSAQPDLSPGGLSDDPNAQNYD